ncbi:hypothetical protein IU405_11940 [Polaribacter sp. BAL334]|jgi:hypothetical protein|uniref:hypothetical protein n=1 Tax=Polaribacter sp. BAL334 TaxID=1708178 RepID=UPI0018D25323|nr:hypothetical protein [Polaribacter sp. BAL334]MBG7612959.1 hypothetical protein [Polaribacter sp. BAL334]
MKQILTNVVLIISVLGLLVSCDRPVCNNTNLIFENNLPDSKIYKDELVKRLKNIDQAKLTYWLQKYDEQNGKESLYFHIQGDGLCAILHLTINNWTKLENVRERKGVGRRGAEFTNLKFKIVKDSISTEFIYKTFDRIID